MDAAQVRAQCARAGVQVSVEGDHLAVRPASRITPLLRRVLTAYKAELVRAFSLADRTEAYLRANGPTPYAWELARALGVDDLDLIDSIRGDRRFRLVIPGDLLTLREGERNL